MSQKKYTFGPVPSRRLGLSLGVDLVPLKTCTQNCIYCQLGVHGEQTTERKPYVDIEAVLTELQQRVDEGLQADYITLSGSGEPTLHSQIGPLIDRIHEMTDIPVALITNATMFHDPAVRRDCLKADVVLPSLDAGDEETFETIDRPAASISFDMLVEGLRTFRTEYTGQIWLEVFFCDGVNTSAEQVDSIKKVTDTLSPDKIHLNTAVRPTANPDAKIVSADKLHAIADILGYKAEVVADYSKLPSETGMTIDEGNVLEMLQRRPCRIQDLCASLGIQPNFAVKLVSVLLKQKKITSEQRGTDVWYKTSHS